MKKKILIFTGTEGHLSIAQAVQEKLQQAGYKAELANLFYMAASNLYTSFYRYFPSLFRIPFELGQKQILQKATIAYVKKLLERKVKNHLKISQPDLIFSSYLFYNPAINKVLDYQKIPIPFINLAADPRTIHNITFIANADFHLVYDEKGVKKGEKQKISKEKLVPTGWFVRKKFYQKQNLNKIRKKLGFKKNTFTLLICGGSEGTNMILKIIPALLFSKKPLQVIVVCGTNKGLYKALLSFKKFLPKIKNKTPVILKLFQFTQQLPQLMAVSDLVMGKAGPNLLFESAAQKKPFFAICHIAGQEDGNLEIIRKKGLGFVEERPFEAIKLLRKIIRNPRLLNQFQESIKKERDYNLQAGKKLIKLVKKLI